MADLIIILILAAVTFLIIRNLCKNKGGCGTCGNDSNGCGCGCSACHRQNKDSKNISKK